MSQATLSSTKDDTTDIASDEPPRCQNGWHHCPGPDLHTATEGHDLMCPDCRLDLGRLDERPADRQPTEALYGGF